MAETALMDDAGRWLADTLVRSLGQALEAMTSESPNLSWSAVSPDLSDLSPSDDWRWWEQALTAAKGAICWVGAPRPSEIAIGRSALLAAGIEEASEEDCSGTWKEIFLQAISAAAQATSKRLAKEVSRDGGVEASKAPSPACCVHVVLSAEAGSQVMRFAWNEILQRALAPATESHGPRKARTDNVQLSSMATPSQFEDRDPAVENSKTLGLLLEVELPISVSFGRAQLPIKDVLKLNSGSIVELNRSINELVDVIVNNCVIARGEVVVVEGNYGVRIKQIISKQERLRTLY